MLIDDIKKIKLQVKKTVVQYTYGMRRYDYPETVNLQLANLDLSVDELERELRDIQRASETNDFVDLKDTYVIEEFSKHDENGKILEDEIVRIRCDKVIKEMDKPFAAYAKAFNDFNIARGHKYPNIHFPDIEEIIYDIAEDEKIEIELREENNIEKRENRIIWKLKFSANVYICVIQVLRPGDIIFSNEISIVINNCERLRIKRYPYPRIIKDKYTRQEHLYWYIKGGSMKSDE